MRDSASTSSEQHNPSRRSRQPVSSNHPHSLFQVHPRQRAQEPNHFIRLSSVHNSKHFNSVELVRTTTRHCSGQDEIFNSACGVVGYQSGSSGSLAEHQTWLRSCSLHDDEGRIEVRQSFLRPKMRIIIEMDGWTCPAYKQTKLKVMELVQYPTSRSIQHRYACTVTPTSVRTVEHALSSPLQNVGIPSLAIVLTVLPSNSPFDITIHEPN